MKEGSNIIYLKEHTCKKPLKEDAPIVFRKVVPIATRQKVIDLNLYRPDPDFSPNSPSAA